MQFKLSLFNILFIGCLSIVSCENDSTETEYEELLEVPRIEFQHYDEKISYCIGLDHGLGASQVYGDKKNEGKFDVSEIQKGLIDYLSDKDLRIPAKDVEAILEKYLLPNGEVNKSEVKIEDASYCVGISEAQYLVDVLVGRGIDQTVDVDFLVLGTQHGMEGGNSLLSFTDAREEIANYYNELNKDQGEAFLAENGKKEGIETTASGLQYEIVKEGTGQTPRLTDTCVVHYTGRFLDGRVFDSSIPSQLPKQFSPLMVIQGWRQALLKMKEGAQWRLFIPYQLAYGEKGNGLVEGYSTLAFDIELIKIKVYKP